MSSISSRLRFFGNTPNAARDILEDMGLIVFVAIVGINAGASLLEQLSGAVALKIFIVGFLASTLPPFVVWAMGLYLFKINPAVLMGATAGARSHSGPAREAAKEIDSSVPWIAFPVGYAISGVLLTIFGVCRNGAGGERTFRCQLRGREARHGTAAAYRDPFQHAGLGEGRRRLRHEAAVEAEARD